LKNYFAKHCLFMKIKFVGLKITDTMRHALEVAVRKGIKISGGKENKG